MYIMFSQINGKTAVSLPRNSEPTWSEFRGFSVYGKMVPFLGYGIWRWSQL